MARFKYLGEIAREGIDYGPTLAIKCKNMEGGVDTYDPVPPATEFVVGDDIGYDITDAKALKQLRVDPRFEEIV